MPSPHDHHTQKTFAAAPSDGLPAFAIYGDNVTAADADRLEEALQFLAKSPLACRLAQSAHNAGYDLVLLPAPPKGRAALRRGYADHVGRAIVLHPATDARDLALTIAHEMAHVSQRRHGAALDLTDAPPLCSIRTLLALEADARAHETLVAVQIAAAQNAAADDGPAAAQERLRDMLFRTADGKPHTMLEKLFDALLPRLPDGVAPEKIMAAHFKAFYADAGQRALYEQDIIDALTALPPDVLQDPQNFLHTSTGTGLLARLDGHALPYLLQAAAHIDLDAPAFACVSDQTLAALSQLQETRRQSPATRNEAAWRAPSYADCSLEKSSTAPVARGPS